MPWVFVLAFAVPAMLVVVLGYAVGHRIWSWTVGPADAEVAGWLTGLLLLAVASWVALRLWRARDRG